ncbi:MAG: DUF411 domain-containing protein [Rhodoferax sp.]
MNKRQFILGALSGTLASTLSSVTWAQAKPVVEVWKSPTCGCCHDWIAHMQANGFNVQAHDVSEADKAAQRRRLGMPAELGSCHTARVGGYTLEGHVPAADVQRLLRERPKAVGLAVPGMPIGSPGMDGPAYGGRRDPFDTLLVLPTGQTQTFAHHK